MKQKPWALLVHLSMHYGYEKHDTLPFDDEMWEWVLQRSVGAGFNTIVLDIGDGLKFGSHMEIAMKGAWSRRRAREEVKRCREYGIALVPKLNFSAGHSQWLGKYS